MSYHTGTLFSSLAQHRPHARERPMRRPVLVVVLFLVFGSGLGLVRYLRSQEAARAAQLPASARLDPAAVAFRIMMGRGDTAPTAWNGSVAVSNGTLIHVEGWQ